MEPEKMDVTFQLGGLSNSEDKLVQVLRNIHSLLKEGWEIEKGKIRNIAHQGTNFAIELSLERSSKVP